MANNLTQETMVAYIDQGGEGNVLVKERSFLASATGSTSVVQADFNDVYSTVSQLNGYLLVCTGGTAANIGEERYVGSYTTSGTMVVSVAWPAATATGDNFTLYSKTGDPVIVCDSDGTATQAVDSTRGGTSEADDHWNGVEAVSYRGPNVGNGNQSTISDFTSSSGTFDFDVGFPGSVLAGDVLHLRQFLYVQNLNFAPAIEKLARPVMRGQYSKLAKINSGKGGTLSFDVEFTPASARAASGTYPAATPYGRLLEYSMGSKSRALSGFVSSSGGSSTTIHYGSVYAAAQDAVILGDEMRWASAVGASGTVTANAALTGTYGGSDLGYGSINYKLVPTSARHFTFDVFHDGVRYQCFNAFCSGISFNFANGAVPMVSLSFNLDHWIVTDETTPVDESEFTNIAPNPVVGSEALIAGSSMTYTDFSLDLGMTSAPKPDQSKANGRNGHVVTDLAPTASITVQLEDDSQIRRFQAGTQVDLAVSSCIDGAGVGVWCRAQIDTVSVADNGGIYYATLGFNIVEQSTTTWSDVVVSVS